MEVARRAYALMPLIAEVALKGNQNAVTDACVAMMSARNAVLGALLNVRINLGSLKDKDFANSMQAEADELERQACAREQELLTTNKQRPQSMNNNVYQIGSSELTFDLIEHILNDNVKLELSARSRATHTAVPRLPRPQDSRVRRTMSTASLPASVRCATAASRPTSWRTLQENLIKSHACSVGEEVRPVIVKLMMLLKAHALSLGYSGVQVCHRTTHHRLLQQRRTAHRLRPWLAGSIGRLSPVGQPLPAAHRCGRRVLQGTEARRNGRTRRVWLGTCQADEQRRTCSAERHPVHEC